MALNIHTRRTLKPQPAALSADFERFIRISPGETRHLKPNAQTIRVVTGRAWVSFEGVDYVLRSGDTLAVANGQFAALISPLGEQPLVYEIGND